MRSSIAGRLSGDSIPICDQPSMEIVPDKWAGSRASAGSWIPGPRFASPGTTALEIAPVPDASTATWRQTCVTCEFLTRM
ncbi:hypothetical protein ABIA06_007195 [Bradyrhizobium yuanmingense]